MSELLTAAQMRAIEQAAIASGEVTGLELMERAGRGVVEAILEEWPELAKTSHRAVVLCGPGNNGGDGFVVARLLFERGWEVEVFLYGDPEKLPPDARVNYERWCDIGGSVAHEVEQIDRSRPFDLRVDAVFGTGLKRGVRKDLQDAMALTRTTTDERAVHPAPWRVAIDCPSCIDVDSGRILEPEVPDTWGGDMHLDFFASLTVTFHRAKIGHFLRGEWDYVHRVKTVDIGLGQPNNSLLERKRDCELVDISNLDEFGILDLHRYGPHKYTHGHALIVSGPATRTGAARLAARGALRIGAGLVTVAAPAPALAEHAAQLTAIMLREANDAGDLANLLEDDRLNALCLGPGMGTGELTRNMVKAALTARRATVLDADALTTFAEDPSALFGMLHETCVLTPHGGEFARLFPDISQRLAEPATTGPAYSKVDATRAAAERAGCTVLFKGADTVIADQTGNCRINSATYDRAAPWLATAGSGDVLAGFITGLLARGHAPIGAASTAAWLHVECARSFGPGLIAEDIPEELPKVFQHLGL